MSQQCLITLPKTVKYDQSFIDKFENNVINTIKQYSLFTKQEKNLVAVSGGKDSTALLYLLNKLQYNIEAITVDAKIGCYSEENLKNIKSFCKKLDVKLHIVSFRDTFGGSLCYLQDVLKEKNVHLRSCNTCGVLRRYLLNVNAKKLNASKLVLGHNMDDEVQSILMNYMKNHLEKSARMGALVGSPKNDFFVMRAKPFYLTEEKHIVMYSKMLKFPVHYGTCPCAEEGYRFNVKSLLHKYESSNQNYLKNFILTFLKQLPLLQKRFSKPSSVRFCQECQEPSSHNLCRTCQIVGVLKT
tara:strand:+ start:1119 stop:2015 length:897 start_codon:yes stop_codon:yes gene_type:complete